MRGMWFFEKNIIAMQGPFSAALNEAMFRECKAEILVTKISGKNGGFYEKITAARKCGMRVLAVTSPHECGAGVFKSEDEILSVLSGTSVPSLCEGGPLCAKHKRADS